MSKYIKVFDTIEEYNAYSGGTSFVSPNVSYVKGNDTSYYDNNEIKTYGEKSKYLELISDEDIENRNYFSPYGKKMMPYAFIKNIVYPSGYTYGNETFSDYYNVESIDFPSDYYSKNNLNMYFLSYCSKLSMNLVLPSGLTSDTGNMCYECEYLPSIEFGANIQTLTSTNAFINTRRLKTLIIRATTPPTIDSYHFKAKELVGTRYIYSIPSELVIYVPSESVELYKSATNWSAFADRIQAIQTN